MENYEGMDFLNVLYWLIDVLLTAIAEAVAIEGNESKFPDSGLLIYILQLRFKNKASFLLQPYNKHQTI